MEAVSGRVFSWLIWPFFVAHLVTWERTKASTAVTTPAAAAVATSASASTAEWCSQNGGQIGCRHRCVYDTYGCIYIYIHAIYFVYLCVYLFICQGKSIVSF